MTTQAEMNIFLKFLGGARLNSSSEKLLQADLEAALTNAGYEFYREFHLGSKVGFVDFAVKIGDSLVGLECKISGSPVDVARQLERYLRTESLSGIVLVTAKAMRMPRILVGKPVWTVSTSLAWL